MEKILNRVTITGADDSIDPGKLAEITLQYPFVEFGILLSSKREGSPRYPSLDWMMRLKNYLLGNLSGHLCGRWVRNLCMGENDFLSERVGLIDIFNRIQLNFHSERHNLDKEKFIEMLNYIDSCPVMQVILQWDGVNNAFLDIAREGAVSVVPLFDLSGGAGELPEKWPESIGYCGYAGGLSLDNLGANLIKIKNVVENPVWIDVETHVRSNDNKQFDIKKVTEFLEIAKNWVIGV